MEVVGIPITEDELFMVLKLSLMQDFGFFGELSFAIASVACLKRRNCRIPIWQDADAPSIYQNCHWTNEF